LPVWVEDNLQILVIGALGLLVLLVLGIRSIFSPSPTPNQEVFGAADLDVVMGPIKTWEDGSAARLKGVQLKIKNRSEFPADGVVVKGKFRGVRLQLKGKAQLAPGEIGDYSLTFPIVVLAKDPMEFTAECRTCVPFGKPHR